MSRVAASWQGNLRSANFENQKPMQNKKKSRNALGDISNRVTRSQSAKDKASGFKKTAKPFQIEKKALIVEEEKVDEHAIDEVDKYDLDCPKYCAEYVRDIYTHYMNVERNFTVNPDYMDDQTDINEKMRALLIDWLCQVHNKFELVPGTLYLTVNILDRFLERKIVSRRKLQLVGCAAMLLASKYEEIYAPELRDFVGMSDNAFTCEDLLRMEGVILNVLKFTLTCPTVYKFLRRYMKIAASSVKVQHHATYLIERSLQEYSLLKYTPSTLAAAALYLANSANNVRPTWNSDLRRLSGYVPDKIEDCAEDLRDVIENCGKHYLQAVKKKYSHHKYMCVSNIPLE